MYRLYKDDKLVKTTSDQSFTFENLVPGETYVFTVEKDGQEKSVTVTTPMDISQMTVAELKESLDSKGIEYKTTDRKKDLIERLAGVGDGI